ncbi:hypothetical protein ACWGCW_04255 [Streptomyces sp. NPDC054933]
MGGASVAETLSFFSNIGLLEGGRGLYSLTKAGRTFAELRHTDSARARIHLRGVFANHWSAQAAKAILADGPLTQEQLAAQLQQGRSGNKTRGTYLAEWLVHALIVNRDKQLRVSLPETPEPAPSQPDEPIRPSGQQATDTRAEADLSIMGLTIEELRHLPDGQYVGVLNGVAQTFTALRNG